MNERLLLVSSEGWSCQHYAGRSVFRHPTLGEKEFSGPIRDYWVEGRVEKLGLPTADSETATIAGRNLVVQRFERGVICQDKASLFLFDTPSLSQDDLLGVLVPALFGRWDMPFEAGVVGIHVALLHTNAVLLWTYEDTGAPHTHTDTTEHRGEWSLLDLLTGNQAIGKQISERNQFCGGQCLLGNGKVLAGGGDRNSLVNDKTVQVFDPIKRWWERGQDLSVGRWYPTLVALGMRSALIVAGDDSNTRVANPTAQVLYDNGATGPVHNFDALLVPPSTYPFTFVLPGRKLFVHLGANTRILNYPPLDFSSSLRLRGVDPGSRTYPLEGTAVLLPLRPSDNPPYRARVMVIGGGNVPENIGTQAKASCELLDLSDQNPAWRNVAPMNRPRVMPDAVLLPDGGVLVVNGSAAGKADLADQPVYEAEIYNPANNTWTVLASMSVPRLYHSTALLLPDGRVLSAGSDREWNQGPLFDVAQDRLEVFSPPYMFLGSRPHLIVAPHEARYGHSFDVATDQADSIDAAVLIRNGSCTHSFNSDQRYVELEIEERLGLRLWVDWVPVQVKFLIWTWTIYLPQIWISRGLRLISPPNENIAPPGYYMLFLVTGGVPSIAKFIQIKPRPAPYTEILQAVRRWFGSRPMRSA